MTDIEIMKALEVCTSEMQNCEICPLLDNCDPLFLDGRALDIINRQNAEIERLKIKNQSLRGAANSYKIHYSEARTEAVKEFAEKLKSTYFIDSERLCCQVDEVFKEMVGETE